MRLEELFLRLKSDPSVLPEIEKEIKLYVDRPGLAPVYELVNSRVPEMKLYALKIVESRIKNKKMRGVVPEEETAFMLELIPGTSLSKAAQIFALLGLYEWPSNFPGFFSVIIDLISHKNPLGYKILESFLYMCNYSQEINDVRKNELKKGVTVMSNAYMPLFDDSMAEYIIPILTESLKIHPKSLDFSIVFRRGAEFPDKAIEFLSEGTELGRLEDVIELASRMEVSAGMILCFNSLKNKAPDVPNLQRMYGYIFKGLRKDIMAFSVSVEFWTKLFGQRASDELAAEVLTEVVSIYLSIDEEQRTDIEGEVLGLFNVISKNNPSCVIEFLKLNGNYLPRKLVLYFLKRLFGFQTSPEIPSDLAFKDPVVDCTLALYRKDSSALDYIPRLDFSDKDSCKLVVRMIEMFSLPEARLDRILSYCDVPNKEHCNEVIVECLMRLGRMEDFSGSWDGDKVVRLFFYLKHAPEHFARYSSSYFEFFLKKAPFDRCFAILKMFGNIPDGIYQKIYSDIDRYSLVDLSCFNRDLLCYIKFQAPFVQKEVVRFIEEWRVSEDPEDLIMCVKSLIQVLSISISGPQPCVNELMEMLQIDDPNVVKRICNVFNGYSGPFDTHRVTYLLLMTYNSSVVEGAHILVSISLTSCIKQDDGAQAFHNILGIELEKCMNLRNETIKAQSKRAQNLIRAFLQDYKGKPLNKLYANEFKVGAQNFLRKGVGDGEFEIPRSFFEQE
jgi:hypothetical protein